MDTPKQLLDHVLVPVANEADARETAAAVKEIEPAHVTALYIVEKADGSIDPVPQQYLKEDGENALRVFDEVFPGADHELTYADNLVERIYSVAADIDATAVAYRSRGGSRFVRLISGDHALKLIKDPPIPVISLPQAKPE